jgi:hypothetical protein
VGVGNYDLDLGKEGRRIHLVPKRGRLGFELLDFLIRGTVDLIELLPCVVNELSALVDRVGHRCVTVCRVVDFERVVHVHNVHRVDRFARILRQQLVGDSADGGRLVR